MAEMLRDLGANIVDTDVIAREVVEPGTPGLVAVLERFGSDVVRDGRLDRKHLASIVFGDAEALADLNAIVHPLIREETYRQVAQLENGRPIVIVVPLLVESGRYPVDGVLVVDVDPAVAVQRLVESRGWTEKQALDRIAAQISREERLAAADFVIDNSGDGADLADAVGKAWDWITGLESISSRRP